MKIFILSLLIVLYSCGKDGSPASISSSVSQGRVGIWGYYDGISEGMYVQYFESGVYNVYYVNGNLINQSSGTFTDDGTYISIIRAADECDDSRNNAIRYRETTSALTLYTSYPDEGLVLEKIDELPSFLNELTSACF